MPTHPGHPAIASTTLVSASRSLLNDAFDSVSIQTLTASATVDPDLGRYILVAPADHMTITLPDPSSDERYQNVRLVLKRTTAGTGAVSVVVAGGGTIDGASSTTLNAQYDCEVLMSDTTAGVWHRLRDASNLLAPDYLDFGDWIVGTDDSNPAPTATSDQYVAPDGTTTADKIEWDNSTELADESWAEPGAASIEAGDTAQYSFYIDSEVGDGVKTVLEVGDSSVPQITEQATVAFSNVFAEDHAVSLSRLYPNLGFGATTTSAVEDPDGGTTATRYEGAVSPRIELSDSWLGGFGIGREFTYSVYFLAEADTRRLELNLANHTSGGSVTDTVNAVFDISASAGVVLSSFTSASSGPSYSSADSYRAEQVSGTDWWKVSVRIVDYTASGNGAQTFVRFKTGSNATDNFVAWRHELRYGNHITGQQLLTVDDGVENILASVGILDATGFDDLPLNVASQSVSSIAAPDGTLTAIETVATSPTVTPVIKALLFETTGTYTQIGDLWQDGLAWTCAIYAYMGQANAARITLQARTLTTAGVQSDYIAVSVQGGSVVNLTSSSTGSVSYSAERNVRVEAVGDTGWYRIELTIQDYAGTCDRIYLEIFGTSDSAYDRHITWNPTLRYGDWVSREKNWLTANDLSEWSYSGQLEPSSTHAPDGTLSAYDFNSTTSDWANISTTSHSIPTTGGAWVYEFWINHTDANWQTGWGRVYFYLSSSTAFTERVLVYIDVAGGATSLFVISTAGPGYTLADNVEQEAIGSDGWWRYRITLFDHSNNAITSAHYWYIRDSGSAGRSTIWNPRLTVGNPADARGYFVSGPQNLLGDGSDYDPATSNWGTGAAPRDVAVTTNTAVAPNGRLEADTLTHTDGQSPNDYLTISISKSAATEAVYYNFYYKIDTALPTGTACERIFFRLLAGATQVESINAYLAYGSDDPVISVTGTTTGGPGYTADDITVTAISNDWVRVSIRLFDYSGTADNPRVLHYNQTPLGTGVDYDVTLWGSEITTIDRTPTATDLRPISGGIVDYDAYPAEHRSLFASYEDAGDNWYKVTMNLTEPN